MLARTNHFKPREIKALLDSIDHESAKPKAGYLRRCVQSATRDLQDGGPSNKHLIVLTCNPFALERLSASQSVQLHVICPGNLPWTYFKPNAQNGWYSLQPSVSSSLCSSYCNYEDSNNRFLASMLSQLRTGQLVDHLENVRITVVPKPGDVIQETMGSTFFESLHVGEKRTLLVRCMVGQSRRSASILESFPRGLRTSSGSMDVEGEINSMLNDESSATFTIKFTYEHSALPPETICQYSKAILTQVESDSRCSTTEADIEHCLIQGRLAYHLASSQRSPMRALAVLTKHYGNMKMGPAMVYVEQLLKELRYQARIQERYELKKAQILPVLQKYSLFPAPVDFDHSDSATSSTMKAPQRSSTFAIQVKKRRSKRDQAQQIWSALRTQKKPEGLSLHHSENKTHQKISSESMHLTKLEALQNGRSIGKDTLRSLYSSKGRENITPWL